MVAPSINPILANRLGLSEQAQARITASHKVADAILAEMERLDPIKDREACRTLAAAWKEIQFILQRTWGFKQDPNYHRWWLLPHCRCPKMDNEDRWGTGYFIKRGDCPLHGTEIN